jgi:hypothetical protein
LAEHLATVTGIPDDVLITTQLSSVSVAQKMSWVSQPKNNTQDMAYCLLEIFDVNMPLLYGEGEKAFSRLQEHIAASSTDHSLLAWSLHSGSSDISDKNLRSYRSVFARSPADFRKCGQMRNELIVLPNTWTQTNRGFHATLPTIPAIKAEKAFGAISESIGEDDYLVILNCVLPVQEGFYPGTRVIGI